MRDRGLLESALARPQHLFAYEGVRALPDLAARYAAGIARNHPFLDGNKRTALLAIRAFLFVNGYTFAPPEGETVAMMLALAAGEVAEGALSQWIAQHARSRKTKTGGPAR